MNFTVQAREDELQRLLVLKNVGWEGAGWGEVCVEDWEEGLGEEEGEKEFGFMVVGRSVLFDTTTTINQTFVVSFPPSSSSSRQLPSSCDASLWDPSPLSLYGIQTFPSGVTLLPPSLRSSSLTITTKALSPCIDIGMSKDILTPFNFDWEFLTPVPEGLVGVDPNNWVVGGGAVLTIPGEVLKDRESFPMNEPVAIKVIIFFS